MQKSCLPAYFKMTISFMFPFDSAMFPEGTMMTAPNIQLLLGYSISLFGTQTGPQITWPP